MLFRDRENAGQLLAMTLLKYKNNPDTLVVGLPRGGVVVAKAVAEVLNLPLDITVPRKISLPALPEFAIGAITETGEGFFDETWIQRHGITPEKINQQIQNQKAEARRRLDLYRQGRPPLSVEGKTVILVDDGIATGFTMIAAIHSLRNARAKKIIVAVPIAPPETREKMEQEADEVIVLHYAGHFFAVGQFYADFSQTSDQEVLTLMKQSHD